MQQVGSSVSGSPKVQPPRTNPRRSFHSLDEPGRHPDRQSPPAVVRASNRDSVGSPHRASSFEYPTCVPLASMGGAVRPATEPLVRGQAAAATTYRRDVQGLRALAVVLVVIFHTGLALPGGFIGVDVFFVISGFVIVRMLSSELTATGTLSLRRFYLRRARRLMPALGLMLAVVLLLSVVFAPIERSVDHLPFAGAAWRCSSQLEQLQSHPHRQQSVATLGVSTDATC